MHSYPSSPLIYNYIWCVRLLSINTIMNEFVSVVYLICIIGGKKALCGCQVEIDNITLLTLYISSPY